MIDIIQRPLFKDFNGYSPIYHFLKNSLLGKRMRFVEKRMMFALKAYLNVSDSQLLECYNRFGHCIVSAAGCL